MRLLILGGTSEASALADALRGRLDIAATLSLAGRTLNPTSAGLAVRVGGFGGPEGLARHIEDQRIDALIDATHPFAARMTANAVAAARRTGTPLLRFTRPPWNREAGDDWREVATMEAAADALGSVPRSVFLTVGRLSLSTFERAPFHRYLIRTIDPPEPRPLLGHATFITARGPFTQAGEIALMADHDVDVLVTKNSGGASAYPKIAAARALGIPVIMVIPPAAGDVDTVYRLDEALSWIDRHCVGP